MEPEASKSPRPFRGTMPDASVLPASVVAALEARARLVRTPCGEGSMAWRVWGEGPALVLFHGGHGSWMHWIANIPELSARYRVIAPDMPGYGASDTPPLPHDADALAAITAQGLARILEPRERVALAGFSFGGIVAGHVARLMRERVARLCLVGSGGLGLPRPPAPTLVDWRLATSEAERQAAHRANLEAIMIADPAAVDALAIHVQNENTAQARVKSRPTSLAATLKRALEEAQVPLAGIWGERDAFAGPYVDARRALLATLDPGSPFAVVKGAGHWVQYEAPDAVNGILADTLGQRF